MLVTNKYFQNYKIRVNYESSNYNYTFFGKIS